MREQSRVIVVFRLKHEISEHAGHLANNRSSMNLPQHEITQLRPIVGRTQDFRELVRDVVGEEARYVEAAPTVMALKKEIRFHKVAQRLQQAAFRRRRQQG